MIVHFTDKLLPEVTEILVDVFSSCSANKSSVVVVASLQCELVGSLGCTSPLKIPDWNTVVGFDALFALNMSGSFDVSNTICASEPCTLMTGSTSFLVILPTAIGSTYCTTI